MKINKKNFSIQLLALLGLGLAIKLAFIYYSANYDRYSLSSFCSINNFIDCDGAARTNTAQFIGIPLAWWGIFFYIIVLFLSFVDKLKTNRFLRFLEEFKNPHSYIAVLGFVAFLISMILAAISLFGIKKLCILCVGTYVLDLVIATVAADGMFKNIILSFKTTFVDFIDGAKKYTKTAIILFILFVSFLVYSVTSLYFVPHIKRRNEILKYHQMKTNPYRVKGNVLGAENAEIIIELYSDYVCPICYINNIMLHKAVKEFKNIKIVHYNYPFDKECNPYISTNMHPYACFMSRGAISAKNQGNYWEMSSLLYENKPKKMDDMLKLVDKLGFDKDKFLKDFDSELTTKRLNEDLELANANDIDATPTMYINGEKYVGVKPYNELKKILIKHGAKRK